MSRSLCRCLEGSCRGLAVLAIVVGVVLGAPCAPAHAETVYAFSMQCRAIPLRGCFDRITKTLDIVKAEGQGRAFCMPEVWVTPGDISRSYPVSLLEHLRLGLSASRFGKAEDPVETAMSDILSDLYPCD